MIYLSNLFKQKIFLFIQLMIFLIAMEISTFRIIFGVVLPKYYMLELAAIIVISSPVFLFKKNLFSIIYSVLVFGIFEAIYIANLNFDYASGDVLTMGYLLVIKEALEVASSSFINLWYILFAVGFGLAYIITLIYYIIFISKKKEKNKYFKYYPISLVYLFFIISIGIMMKNATFRQIEADNVTNELYKEKTGRQILNDTSSTLKKGSLIKYGIFNHFIYEFYDLYLANDKALAKKEIDDYLANGKDNEQNDFSGLLKDYNVLEIMIESAPSYVLSPTLTPNLYKLSNEGLYFSNNLCKNKTNYSEILGMIGSSYNAQLSSGYNSPYSLANILNEKGYKTSYFHDNDKKFYNRGTVIEEVGFKNRYFHQDFFDTKVEFKGNMPYDTDFVNKTIDLMLPKEKFYTFWTTISTHGPYNTSMESLTKYKNYVGLDGIKYYDKLTQALEDETFIMPTSPKNPYVRRLSTYNFKSEEEKKLIEEQLIHFELEMMNFDEALGILLNKLEKENRLDDTLIILYGDHDAYYTSNKLKPLKYYVYGAIINNEELEEYPNQYETYMCMYNPKLNKLYKEKVGQSVTMLTNPGIIVPTTLDLLGINYNKNAYLYSSIFNSTDISNLMYSYEIECIFSDKILAYDYNEFKFVANDVDDAYKNKFNEASINILKKNLVIHKMYKYNYFGR